MLLARIPVPPNKSVAGVGQTVKREAVDAFFFNAGKRFNERRMIIGGDVMNGGIIFLVLRW